VEAVSIVQRGNLQSLEKTLRRQWRLGQNIVLCWSLDARGLLVIFVPHYFLGNYCAPGREDAGGQQDNERYIRQLISGKRRKSRDELFAVAVRLGASPTFIKLDHPLEDHPAVVSAVEQIIRRYGLGYVDRRAVLLFDISDFSLRTPFEQASQLNSLSYSMNSVYNKLAARGMEINFARTTTGDGYYVWNRDRDADADSLLFYFLVLIMLDNALASRASRGRTVPLIRAAFHIGSHYELYQAEGVNPTVFSYIVGDVTIELARLIDKAEPGQILVGDFALEEDGANDSGGSPAFVADCDSGLERMQGIKMMGSAIDELSCWLTASRPLAPRHASPLELELRDKHGLMHQAYNLEIAASLGDVQLRLGHSPEQLRALQ
jgi:class 3 adenylate cyclase